jgi:hypothetical protein
MRPLTPRHSADLRRRSGQITAAGQTPGRRAAGLPRWWQSAALVKSALTFLFTGLKMLRTTSTGEDLPVGGAMKAKQQQRSQQRLRLMPRGMITVLMLEDGTYRWIATGRSLERRSSAARRAGPCSKVLHRRLDEIYLVVGAIGLLGKFCAVMVLLLIA